MAIKVIGVAIAAFENRIRQHVSVLVCVYNSQGTFAS